MSTTKALSRYLAGASTAAVEATYDHLIRQYAGERNPMIRSSLKTRMRMCEAEIGRRRGGGDSREVGR